MLKYTLFRETKEHKNIKILECCASVKSRQKWDKIYKLKISLFKTQKYSGRLQPSNGYKKIKICKRKIIKKI
jgi:hypothetical protein